MLNRLVLNATRSRATLRAMQEGSGSGPRSAVGQSEARRSKTPGKRRSRRFRVVQPPRQAWDLPDQGYQIANPDCLRGRPLDFLRQGSPSMPCAHRIAMGEETGR